MPVVTEEIDSTYTLFNNMLYVNLRLNLYFINLNKDSSIYNK